MQPNQELSSGVTGSPLRLGRLKLVLVKACLKRRQPLVEVPVAPEQLFHDTHPT